MLRHVHLYHPVSEPTQFTVCVKIHIFFYIISKHTYNIPVPEINGKNSCGELYGISWH